MTPCQVCGGVSRCFFKNCLAYKYKSTHRPCLHYHAVSPPIKDPRYIYTHTIVSRRFRSPFVDQFKLFFSSKYRRFLLSRCICLHNIKNSQYLKTNVIDRYSDRYEVTPCWYCRFFKFLTSLVVLLFGSVYTVKFTSAGSL